MSRLACNLTDFILNSVDTRVCPATGIVDEADHLDRPPGGKIVNDQPGFDGVGGLVDHSPNFRNGHASVGRLSERDSTNTAQWFCRDLQEVVTPSQECPGGDQVMVDGLGGESPLEHVEFEGVKVSGGDIGHHLMGRRVQEALQVFAVIPFQISPAFESFGDKELVCRGYYPKAPIWIC